MPLILNEPLPFSPLDRVAVVTTTNESEQQLGTIYMKEMAPLNSALPGGDQTEHIYVAFDNQEVYSPWLQRGSNILLDGTKKYVVETIHRNRNGSVTCLDIYPYWMGGCFRPLICLRISIQDIHAMLIWLVAYDMKKV